MASLAAMFWTQGLRLESYLAHPLSTTIEVQYDATLAYPAVTICNINSIQWVGIGLTQLPLDKMAAISKTIFSENIFVNEMFCI